MRTPLLKARKPLKSRSSRSSDGFTLLEVLIAIMILVMAVATILPLFALGTMAHKRGMDQAHLSWLAPRIAARIQQRMYDRNPENIRGYVRQMEDGSILVEETKKSTSTGGDTSYRFTATFDPVASGSGSAATNNAAFHLTVVVHYLEEGDEQGETFRTIVLRKLRR